jgi:hypothetical protein
MSLRPVRREYLGVGMVGFTVAYGGLVYWAATAGTSAAWTALVVVSVGIAVAFSVAAFRRDSRFTVSPLERAPGPHDGVYRVLVVVDAGTAGFAGHQLESLAESTAGRPSEALVVAPALSSRLDRLTGDQSAYDDAATCLHEMINALEEIGMPARGRIGSHDPLVAIEEGLREFPADSIVLVTRRADRSNWLESGVLANTIERTDIPVSRLIVDETVPG